MINKGAVPTASLARIFKHKATLLSRAFDQDVLDKLAIMFKFILIPLYHNPICCIVYKIFIWHVNCLATKLYKKLEKLLENSMLDHANRFGPGVCIWTHCDTNCKYYIYNICICNIIYIYNI